MIFFFFLQRSLLLVASFHLPCVEWLAVRTVEEIDQQVVYGSDSDGDSGSLDEGSSNEGAAD